MSSQATAAQPFQIEAWHIDRFIPYARNPRKNDAAVDRMCASIREFGFKVPALARSDGTVVDGHLRLKAARKLGSWPGGDITGIPVLLCDEWSDAQVKAFRLLVNRSVTWAEFDDELLTLELQDLAAADFDLSLTGFDPRELETLLTLPDNDEQADVAPPLPFQDDRRQNVFRAYGFLASVPEFDLESSYVGRDILVSVQNMQVRTLTALDDGRFRWVDVKRKLSGPDCCQIHYDGENHT